MEFQHRPKQRAKRLVKKMLGRPVAPLVTENQQTEQPVSSCVGSIDSFSYENNVLQIIGWAFDRAYAMENTHLAFLQNGEVVAEEPAFPRSNLCQRDQDEVPQMHLHMWNDQIRGVQYQIVIQ